jgi:Ca2+-transporting ATPase
VLIGILLVAALISGAMGEWPETVAILTIVLINAGIGFLQEERAERALKSLRKLAAPTCRVTRDGHERTLPAAELVPGDVIHVESGDQIPADARLLESISLRTQEASLTGESIPVRKDAATVLSTSTPLADRRNMIYAGTVVAAGKGRAIIVATGMGTELGHIAGMLEQTESQPTPLQRRLAILGKRLAIVCGLIISAIFLIYVARARSARSAALRR